MVNVFLLKSSRAGKPERTRLPLLSSNDESDSSERSVPGQIFAQNNSAPVADVEKDVLGRVNFLANLLTIAA